MGNTGFTHAAGARTGETQVSAGVAGRLKDTRRGRGDNERRCTIPAYQSFEV